MPRVTLRTVCAAVSSPSEPPMPAPYTLWEATLSSGDTAKVIISPWAGEAGVIMHWNGALHSFERVPTVVHAEHRAWQLHAQVLAGEPAARNEGS